MKATKRVPFARPVREQLREHDIPVHDLARDAYRGAITDTVTAPLAATKKPPYWRLMHRRSDLESPLGEVCRDVVLLYNAGATEAAVRGLELCLRDVIDRCFAGVARRDVRLIDIEEQLADGLEDVLTIQRRNAAEMGRPLEPEQLEEEARVNTQLAALLLERARGLRALAGKAAAAPAADRPRPITRVLRADAVGA